MIVCAFAVHPRLKLSSRICAALPLSVLLQMKFAMKATAAAPKAMKVMKKAKHAKKAMKGKTDAGQKGSKQSLDELMSFCNQSEKDAASSSKDGTMVKRT